MLRMVYEISSMIDIPPEQAWAFATGNVADAYKLEVGRIRPGAPADLLAMHVPIDAPTETALECLARGDLPSVTMIMVEGRLIAEHGRNTRFCSRKIRV